MAGRYRVTVAEAGYFYLEGLAEAQSEALDWAREVTFAAGTARDGARSPDGQP